MDLSTPGIGGGADFGPASPGGYGPGGLPAQAGMPMGGPGFDMGPSMMPQQMPSPVGAGAEQIENLRRSVESLSYKMDTLKAALDNISARLANIETAMKASPQERGEGWGAF